MKKRREIKLDKARLEALSQLSQVITSLPEPRRIVEIVLHTIGELMEGVVVQLWQLHDEKGVLILVGSHGVEKATTEDTLSIPVGQGVVGEVAASRSPIAVEDLRKDPSVIPGHFGEQEGLVSFLGLPLLRDETLFGVLSIFTRTPQRFHQEEINIFTSFARQVAIALEHAHCYQDLQQSYQVLLAAQAELVRETRMATIGEIAAALSHETRNFLGALSTCLNLLRANPHITGEDAELLDIIHDGSQRLDQTVSDLLAFGCATPPHFQDVDLHELIDETFAVIQRDPRCPSSIVFHGEFGRSVLKVRADRDRLRQVFWNLFLNAVESMKEKGTLHVQTRIIDNRVEIVIRDSGSGIPADVLPKIFEPFYSTKSGGTGLGLSIVRHIVEEHRGQIIVDAQQDVGACFKVSLPFEPKDNLS